MQTTPLTLVADPPPWIQTPSLLNADPPHMMQYLLGCRSPWIQTPSPLDADSPRCRPPGGRTPPLDADPALFNAETPPPTPNTVPLPQDAGPPLEAGLPPPGCRMSGRHFQKHFLPLRSVIGFTNFHFSVIRSL